MKIERLGYVRVGSVRAAEWDRFGPEILGTPVSLAKDGATRWLRLDDRAYRLAITPADRDQLLATGWEVAGGGALEEAIEELRGKGVSVERATPTEADSLQVADIARFRDPFGLVHEIFHGQTGGLAFEPTRPISGFVTGELGLGHVVLAVPNRETAIHFATRTLGFRLSDTMDQPCAAFFHCNPRHHSLAVASFGPLRGLHHVMMEVRDMNDVGTTYDLCRSRGLPIAMDLGRHSNDEMFSFYVRTPGGFEIEYGWGGLLVDDAKWAVANLPGPSFWGHQALQQAPPTTIEPMEPGA